MLQLSFVDGLTGDYVDFTTAQRAALTMLAERHGVVLTDATADAVVARMRTLPHPEVPAALAKQAETRLTVVALTNSPLEVAEAQLSHAGIRQLFTRAISADSVRRLKPAREPCRPVRAFRPDESMTIRSLGRRLRRFRASSRQIVRRVRSVTPSRPARRSTSAARSTVLRSRVRGRTLSRLPPWSRHLACRLGVALAMSSGTRGSGRICHRWFLARSTFVGGLLDAPVWCARWCRAADGYREPVVTDARPRTTGRHPPPTRTRT